MLENERIREIYILVYEIEGDFIKTDRNSWRQHIRVYEATPFAQAACPFVGIS